jgi:hypothetical protein
MPKRPSQQLTPLHLDNYSTYDGASANIPSPYKMNPLDLLLLRNGSQARLRTGSSHAISTNINEMMDQIPENNPKSGQIGTKFFHITCFPTHGNEGRVAGTSQHICNVCIEMIKRLSSLPSYI